jgi:hypothetical protein
VAQATNAGEGGMTKAQAREFGAAPSPELVERVEALERQGAEQARVIEQLQAKVAALEAQPADDEDGAARPAGKWLRMKAAAAATGYSEAGLRKVCREGRCAADYLGPHLLVNVDSVPRRSVKISKV